MPPKKKGPKAQKESLVKSAQQSIQQQLQKTKPKSPPKTEQPVELPDSDSSSDEDFNPDEQPAADEESSSSEDETPAASTSTKKQKGKRKRDDDIVDAELASGDEVTIQQRAAKKRKRGADDDFLSDDEGGDAGFIKTRSQRRVEQQEKRPVTRIENATIDVDALWTKLASLPIGRPPEPLEPPKNEDDYITIQRTTKFAGQLTTEERRVLKSSQEARIYLAEQEANNKIQQEQEKDAQLEKADAVDGEALADVLALPALRRPLFRKSRFEPNPTGEVKALPPHLQLRWPRDKLPPGATAPATDENMPFNPRALPKLTPAAKLNTVQKSKYDWAGYVDQAGIADELDEYGKSKQSYAERTAFLNRTEGRRDDERLAAKTKTG